MKWGKFTLLLFKRIWHFLVPLTIPFILLYTALHISFLFLPQMCLLRFLSKSGKTGSQLLAGSGGQVQNYGPFFRGVHTAIPFSGTVRATSDNKFAVCKRKGNSFLADYFPEALYLQYLVKQFQSHSAIDFVLNGIKWYHVMVNVLFPTDNPEVDAFRWENSLYCSCQP